MRTANPALSATTFSRASYGSRTTEVMTLGGTVNKTFILTALLIASAAFSWNLCLQNPANYPALTLVGLIGGLIVGMITVFKKTAAPYTAPIYALFEGLLLGGISVMFEQRFPGIVFQAFLGTMGTLLCLLMAYKSGVIRATENFKLGVAAATGAVFFLYLISFILGFFGVPMNFLHDSSPLSIGISVVIIAIAAFNLVLDFDFIEQGAEAGAPKYMEWYAGFGLLVTLVWLYIEFLRLLSKLQSRR
ncbi:MAG: Bax inhibitor-1/YccA family protein [Deltaproteobacteria bacterium]|nr:Bax inhibitor-1/YccA family protein [Deltaproteobacteria bacterium]